MHHVSAIPFLRDLVCASCVCVFLLSREIDGDDQCCPCLCILLSRAIDCVVCVFDCIRTWHLHVFLILLPIPLCMFPLLLRYAPLLLVELEPHPFKFIYSLFFWNWIVYDNWCICYPCWLIVAKL